MAPVPARPAPAPEPVVEVAATPDEAGAPEAIVPQVEEPVPEEAEVAPPPVVLTESGTEESSGEPAPIPEATPEQVPEVIAEAASQDTSVAVSDDSDSSSGGMSAPEVASPEPEPTPIPEGTPPVVADAPVEAHPVLKEHHEALHTLRKQVTNHGAATEDLRKEFEQHEHELPEHEHELPEHEHELPEHQHELPEHEHEVAEHEHELVPHDHEDYKAALETQGGDIHEIHTSVEGLQSRLAEREKEIQRLQKIVDESEQTRAALMKEIAFARADREKFTSSLPVVMYDADEKRVHSVNLFASGRGEALEKLLGGMIQAWQSEGKSVDVTGLPPHMAVKVRDDPLGRGFELFPSSMLFLRITSKEREALGSLPPLVSQPDKKGERRN